MTLNLRQRIGLGYLVAIAAMLLLLLMSSFVYFEAQRTDAAIRKEFVPRIEYTNDLVIVIERMENAEWLYFLGESPERSMQRFDLHAAEFERRYLETRPIATEPEEREQFTRLGQAFQSYRQIDRRLRELLRKGRKQEAMQLDLGASNLQADLMREASQKLHALNLDEIVARQEAQTGFLRSMEILRLILMTLMILLLYGFWLSTTRRIAEPLFRLRDATRRISEGQFVQLEDPEAAGTIELGELQADFNRMSSKLAGLTRELRGVNEELESRVTRRTHELSEANQKLEGLVEELKTLDQLKSNFMAVTSHELLTPINFITGFGSILEEGQLGPLTPPQEDAVAKILGGAERLTRIVRKVLDYTRLEGKGIELRAQEFDYAALLKDVVGAVRPEAEKKGQQLELSLPEELPPAFADPERVGQILGELLENAIKFSPEGGKIRIEASSEPGGIATTVSDRGIGIAKEQLSHLFDPFHQIDSSLTRPFGGLGLGLAIAHRLAKGMGGELSVRSSLGKGSTFRFTLRRAG